MSVLDLLTVEQLIAAYVPNNDARRGLQLAFRAKEAVISDLRESVAFYAEMADACSYDTLKTICSYCHCPRRGNQ